MCSLMLPFLIGYLSICPPEGEGSHQNTGGSNVLSLCAAQPGQTGMWRLVADDGDDHPVPSGGPWLGVQFGPIPPALAAHLSTNDGMLILNVAKNSPADNAGLKQYDVLVKINKFAVPSDIKECMDYIKDLTVGQATALRVIRGGQEQSISLTIGSRPDNLGEIEYKYEAPKEMATSQTETLAPQFYQLKNGQLLQPDAEAFKKIEKLMPRTQGGNGQFTFQLPHGQLKGNIVLRHELDGESCEIRHGEDGQITVKRTGKDGKTSKKTYASVEELRKDDADAASIFDTHGAAKAMQWHMTPGQNGQGFQFDFDGDQLHKHLQKAIEQQLKGDLGKPQGLGTGAWVGGATRATSTFERMSDGSIKVRTQDGDDELVETYKNADQLKQARPDLYKRYSKMHSRSAKSEKSSDDNDD